MFQIGNKGGKMNKEEIKIITLGDIFRNLETEEQAFEFLKYIKNLQQENQKYKEVIDKEIEYINKYESIRAYYEYIDEDGYEEYNYDKDFKKELLDILKEVKTC